MSFFAWYQLKLLIEHASGISMDALHILVGMILFLVVARILRSDLGSVGPWVALLLIELGNEAYDLHVELWPNLGSQLGEGVKDILLTMAIPTILLAMVRWRAQWLVGGHARFDPPARD